jgi:hypothetical protein
MYEFLRFSHSFYTFDHQLFTPIVPAAHSLCRAMEKKMISDFTAQEHTLSSLTIGFFLLVTEFSCWLLWALHERGIRGTCGNNFQRPLNLY